jgi:hypothetical protein
MRYIVNIVEKYLLLLKDFLLNESYLENELRILFIFSMLSTGDRLMAISFETSQLKMQEWMKSARALASRFPGVEHQGSHAGWYD